MHGSNSVPWSDISTLAVQLEEVFTRSIMPSSRASDNIAKVCCLGRIQNKFKDPNEGLSLLDLVLGTSKFKVTDPADKIFALVGLAKDVTDADWEVSPTMHQVWKPFTINSLSGT